MHKWFEHDDVWHAFNLADPAALCGELRITYGVDQIADDVPAGGEAHQGCLDAIAKAAEPEAEAEPEEEPAPKKSKK